MENVNVLEFGLKKILAVGVRIARRIFTLFTGKFIIDVDYSLSLEEMMDAGDCETVYTKFNEGSFPPPAEYEGKKVTLASKVLSFDKWFGVKEVLSEMDKLNYRPATLAEMLALLGDYPGFKVDGSLIALGSDWKSELGFPHMPILIFCEMGRLLSLQSLPRHWPQEKYYFLAIPK